MKFLLGGQTGLCKTVDVTGKDVKLLSSPLDGQKRSEAITCIQWTGSEQGHMSNVGGAFGSGEPDKVADEFKIRWGSRTEYTVGRQDGTVAAYHLDSELPIRDVTFPSPAALVQAHSFSSSLDTKVCMKTDNVTSKKRRKTTPENFEACASSTECEKSLLVLTRAGQGASIAWNRRLGTEQEQERWALHASAWKSSKLNSETGSAECGRHIEKKVGFQTSKVKLFTLPQPINAAIIHPYFEYMSHLRCVTDPSRKKAPRNLELALDGTMVEGGSLYFAQIAFGGKDNNLKIYDFLRGETIFEAKSQPHTFLGFREEVHIRSLSFLSNHERLPVQSYENAFGTKFETDMDCSLEAYCGFCREFTETTEGLCANCGLDWVRQKKPKTTDNKEKTTKSTSLNSVVAVGSHDGTLRIYDTRVQRRCVLQHSLSLEKRPLTSLISEFQAQALLGGSMKNGKNQLSLVQPSFVRESIGHNVIYAGDNKGAIYKFDLRMQKKVPLPTSCPIELEPRGPRKLYAKDKFYRKNKLIHNISKPAYVSSNAPLTYSGEVLGHLHHAMGAIEDIKVDPTSGSVIAAGLGRYAYVYNGKNRKMTQKVYCKQKLSRILI